MPSVMLGSDPGSLMQPLESGRQKKRDTESSKADRKAARDRAFSARRFSNTLNSSAGIRLPRETLERTDRILEEWEGS